MVFPLLGGLALNWADTVRLATRVNRRMMDDWGQRGDRGGERLGETNLVFHACSLRGDVVELTEGETSVCLLYNSKVTVR